MGLLRVRPSPETVPFNRHLPTVFGPRDRRPRGASLHQSRGGSRARTRDMSWKSTTSWLKRDTCHRNQQNRCRTYQQDQQNRCSRVHNIDFCIVAFLLLSPELRKIDPLAWIILTFSLCSQREPQTGASKRELPNGNPETGTSKREFPNGDFQTRTPKRESPNRSLQTGTSKRESISAELQNPLTGDATTALHLRDHFVALPRVRTSTYMFMRCLFGSHSPP